MPKSTQHDFIYMKTKTDTTYLCHQKLGSLFPWGKEHGDGFQDAPDILSFNLTTDYMIYVKSVKYSLSCTDYLHFSVSCNSITSFKKLLKKINHLLCSDGGLVTKSCPTLVTPWTVACQAPLSMGLSKQEYWSKLPFPSPGDLLQTQVSCTTGRFFTD